MIMTYDFILIAWRNENFMKQIREAISNSSDCEICTDIHRLSFNEKKQTIMVKPYSKTSDFHWKIISKEITYQVLVKMLNRDWNNIKDGDIKDI